MRNDINTDAAAAIVALNPDGTSVYIAGGERVLIQKSPTTSLDGTGGGSSIWASAVGFTN